MMDKNTVTKNPRIESHTKLSKVSKSGGIEQSFGWLTTNSSSEDAGTVGEAAARAVGDQEFYRILFNK